MIQSNAHRPTTCLVLFSILLALALTSCARKNSCASAGDATATNQNANRTARVEIAQKFVSDYKEQPPENAPALERVATNLLTWSGAQVVTGDADYVFRVDTAVDEMFADYGWSRGGGSFRMSHAAKVVGKVTVENRGAIVFERRLFSEVGPPPNSGLYHGSKLHIAISRSFTTAMYEAVGNTFGYAFMNKLAEPNFLGEIPQDLSSARIEWELYDEGLAQVRDPNAVAGLVEIVNRSERSSLGWRATEALGEIRNACAVDSLIEAMQYYPWFFQDDYYGTLRENAAVSLGKIGDPRALPALRSVPRRMEGDILWTKAQEAIKAIESQKLR